MTRIERPAGLLWLIALTMLLTAGIGLGGIVLVLIFVSELSRSSFPMSNLTALAIASLLMLFGIVTLLGRPLSRLMSVYLQTGETAAQEKRKPKLNKRAAPAQLDAPGEPISSVTEHTTRTFEPSFKERNTQR